MPLASCHAFQVQTVSRAKHVARAADGGGLPSGIGLSRVAWPQRVICRSGVRRRLPRQVQLARSDLA
jgi:hypothetical protein